MLMVETTAKIRRLQFTEGKGIKTICRDLKLSKKVVRKVICTGITEFNYTREIEEFTFDDTPINETLVRDLASGEFLSQQRNIVLVGGTGTGKTCQSASKIAPLSASKNDPLMHDGSWPDAV